MSSLRKGLERKRFFLQENRMLWFFFLLQNFCAIFPVLLNTFFEKNRINYGYCAPKMAPTLESRLKSFKKFANSHARTTSSLYRPKIFRKIEKQSRFSCRSCHRPPVRGHNRFPPKYSAWQLHAAKPNYSIKLNFTPLPSPDAQFTNAPQSLHTSLLPDRFPLILNGTPCDQARWPTPAGQV